MLTLKICGLREPEHALAAAEAGANMLGLNFVPGARRRITSDQARAIVTAVRTRYGARAPKLAGLFQDQPIKEVNDLIRAVGLDYVQLTGNESLEYWKQLVVPPLKVVHVRGDIPREQNLAALHTRLAEINKAGFLVILDKYAEGQSGGTGQSFDWTLAQELASRGHRFLLAGGLTPENVGQAVKTVHPFGVDVSSGVEINGAKDARKIQAFIQAVRSTEGAA